jgi:hypothetical protein
MVIDSRDEGAEQKWPVAGKILYRHVFHINTISSALRTAWGNPKRLMFRSVGVCSLLSLLRLAIETGCGLDHHGHAFNLRDRPCFQSPWLHTILKH